jgi:hypothetical protein
MPGLIVTTQVGTKAGIPAIAETFKGLYSTGNDSLVQTIILQPAGTPGSQFNSPTGFSQITLSTSGAVQLTGAKAGNPTYINQLVNQTASIDDEVDTFSITNTVNVPVTVQIALTAGGNSTPAVGIVISVNGKTGVVELDASDIPDAASSTALAAASGATLVGYGNGTVADALNADSLTDYSGLRTYTGNATSVRLTGYLVTATPSSIAGSFTLDSTDNTTPDDGGVVIRDNLGRRWKRQYSGAVSAEWWQDLVAGTGAQEDWTVALTTAFAAYPVVDLPYRALGYRTTSPVTVNSGQRLTGKGLIFRDDQNDHILSLMNVTDVWITGLSFSHNYFMVGDRGNKSAIYGFQSSQVKVTDCQFNNIGLFAVSTDVSGDGWTVTNNRFYNIAGTCYDARGGRGHLVTDNYVLNTGDDAFDVANTPGVGSKRTIVANNVIINPGQIKVGGGGIRVNSAGAIVVNNQFENANMYFVVVAALSTDGTIRPNQVIVANNVGYGIKPTTNNTTGAVLVKNTANVKIHDNDFDVVGDGTIDITNVVDNGSAQCRFTAPDHGYTSGNVVRIDGVQGVPGANGQGAVVVIDQNTFDITALEFSGTYAGGGQVWNAIVGVRFYSGDNTPTQNGVAEVHDNRFIRCDSPYRVMLLGLNKLYFNNNTIDQYYLPQQFFDQSTMAKLQMNRNRWVNCKAPSGIFDGNGAGLVTIQDLEMNDNELTPAVGVDVTTIMPINFNLAAVARAEALRNKLNACGGRTAPTNIQQFLLGNNVPQFFFDGDYSGTRYNQGAGVIAQGATQSTPVAHGCMLVDGQAQQPKTFELDVTVSLGATVPVFLQATQEFSQTFVAATNVAATAPINFVWRLEPVVQRYVNGALST